MKKLVLLVLSLCLAGMLLSSAALAADFPTKPIEIIVGYSAGGANHLSAENLTFSASDVFGVPVVVTTMPGGSSAVANNYVSISPADGYTLLNGSLSLPISMYVGTVDFSKEDFVAIAMFSEVVPCLVVRASLPVNNLDELVAYCQANPGSFSWGHSGVGSTLHLAGSYMFKSLGIMDLIKEVPFTGTNEAVAQVLGEHIDAVLSFPATVQEQVRAGNLKVLGVSSTERVAEFPDTMTFEEQGYDVLLTSTRGIFARSDTPQEILDVLEDGFRTIIQSEDFMDRAVKLGEPPVYRDSEEATALYLEQCTTIEELIKELGLDL